MKTKQKKSAKRSDSHARFEDELVRIKNEVASLRDQCWRQENENSQVLWLRLHEAYEKIGCAIKNYRHPEN
jgi:hypothetical protein